MESTFWPKLNLYLKFQPYSLSSYLKTFGMIIIIVGYSGLLNWFFSGGHPRQGNTNLLRKCDCAARILGPCAVRNEDRRILAFAPKI